MPLLLFNFYFELTLPYIVLKFLINAWKWITYRICLNFKVRLYLKILADLTLLKEVFLDRISIKR